MRIIVFSGSKTIHLLHLLSFLSFVLSQSPENMPFYCPHSPNNTASEKFTFNLQSFLRIISDAAGTRAYYKTTTGGNYPNKVYGLYLCRGDVNNELCHKCVDLATDTIQNDCDGTKEAIIWSDECMVRYSDRSFSSNFETSPNNCSTNRENVTEPEKMRKIVSKSLDEVITREIFNNEYKYATHVVNFSGNHRLYSLVQCIPELSMEECRACLMSAAASILRCYRDKQGARFLNPSCCIRFELYPFFSEREAQTSSPDAGNAERGRKESRMRIEIGTLVSAVIIIVGLISCFLWRMRRCEKDEEGKVISQEVQLLELGESQIGSDHSFILQEVKLVESKEFPMFPFDLTLEATQHFSEENKLGEGGFGPVYKGILADGKEIAVKRLSSTSGQGIEEFKNEVTLIAKLQHKNLVRLLGCCSGGNELLLIYEYMPNKSLDFLLFDSTRSVQLDWKRRVGIINGIARGLLYLHEDSRLKIIHRDLKTSNILLDHEMNPKISDFGMARIFEGNQNEVNTIRWIMAPEYAMGGQFSVKSDVFSFGVIVLEIISGKKNSGFYLSGQSRSLLTYAWKLWCEGNAMELVDPLVKQSYNPDELLKCIHIGLLCVQDDPADRPIMSSVVVMLASDRMTPPQPTQPAFFVGRNAAKSSQQLDTKVCSVNEVTLSIVSPR